MNCITVNEAGGFWAECRDGRRYRVTAYRMVHRSPCGTSYRAKTRLSLVGGGEVRWVRGRLYLSARVGTLFRIGLGVLTTRP
jgi:hypothetical protein